MSKHFGKHVDSLGFVARFCATQHQIFLISVFERLTHWYNFGSMIIENVFGGGVTALLPVSQSVEA